MNPNNYASLEASNRLVKAGIVLVTEAGWWRRNSWQRWSLGYRGLVEDDPRNIIIIPAPGMAEVWRELPEASAYLHTNKETEVWLEDEEDIIPKSNSFANTNPTDSLIYLLIWVRKKASHEFREFQERDQ